MFFNAEKKTERDRETESVQITAFAWDVRCSDLNLYFVQIRQSVPCSFQMEEKYVYGQGKSGQRGRKKVTTWKQRN